MDQTRIDAMVLRCETPDRSEMDGDSAHAHMQAHRDSVAAHRAEQDAGLDTPGRDENGLYPSERPYAKETGDEPLSPHVPEQPFTLPQTTEERKDIPLASGVLDYFPAALAEVAKVSKAGNDKHNPGQPMHWARGKSMDQADCIARHLLERGGIDPETGQLHSAQMAWRALALLQLELEQKGAPMARGARD